MASRRRKPPVKNVLKASLRRLARKIMRQPWNRPGADKSWVVRTHYSYGRLLEAISRAERIET